METTIRPVALRPWEPSDADELLEIFLAGGMGTWIRAEIADRAGASRWIAEQQRGRRDGDRYAFAVTEGGDHRPVGHVVVKDVTPAGTTAEVGYWTAAHARGRSIAPRAVEQAAGWAFTTIPRLTHLGLLHQVDNPASCRVAVKTGFHLAETLPPAPPAYPGEGHHHVRRRPPE